MRKNLDNKTVILPMPVFIITTYNEDGSVNAMNAAWGGTFDEGKLFVSLSKHKTSDNLVKRKAFCVSLASKELVEESDYFGLIIGYKVNKIQKTNLKVIKSEFVDAPIIEKYPLTFECKVESFKDGILIGDIINVSVDTKFIDENGKIDIEKMGLLCFDPINNTYRLIGENIAKAFNVGKIFLK